MQTSTGKVESITLSSSVRQPADARGTSRGAESPEASRAATRRDRMSVRPGQVVVTAGDSLSVLARRHGVPLDDLLRLNPGLTTPVDGGRPRAADGRWIYPGDVVQLRPAGAKGLPKLPEPVKPDPAVHPARPRAVEVVGKRAASGAPSSPAPKAAVPAAEDPGRAEVRSGRKRVSPGEPFVQATPLAEGGRTSRPRPDAAVRKPEGQPGGSVADQQPVTRKPAVPQPAPEQKSVTQAKPLVQPKPAAPVAPKPVPAVDRSGVPELISRIPKGTGTVLGMVSVTIARIGNGLKIQAGSFGTFLFQKTGKGWCITGAGQEPLAVDKVRQARDGSGNTVFSLEFPKGSPVPFNPAVVSVAPDGRSFSMAGYSITME